MIPTIVKFINSKIKNNTKKNQHALNEHPDGYEGAHWRIGIEMYVFEKKSIKVAKRPCKLARQNGLHPLPESEDDITCQENKNRECPGTDTFKLWRMSITAMSALEA